MGLVQMLEQINPKNVGILFKVVGSLENPEEIRQFYQEYALFLGYHGSSILTQLGYANVAAARNIAYILGSCEKEMQDLWRKAIPELEKIFDEINNPSPAEIIRNLEDKAQGKKC